MMTSKQTAMLNVAKLVGVALFAGALTSALVAFVPMPLLGIGVCVIVMLYLVHMIYELELSKAEYRESLTRLKQDLEG
jgi:fatty acid desaturase